MKRYDVVFWMVSFLLWSAMLAGAAEPSNPQPAPGDIVLPMPKGVKMVFRPVFLGPDAGPVTNKMILVGTTDPKYYKETKTKVKIGGAFQAEHRGQLEWLYYLGKYEVSAAQYYAIMEPDNPAVPDSRRPMTNISWFDVQDFIKRYNLWLFEHAKDQLPRHGDAIGFVRLPTEIEWEFAARGGTAVDASQFEQETPYTGNLAKHEWFRGAASSFNTIHDIGMLAPNPLALHDMLGNVSEMTASLYQLRYYEGRIGGFVARGGNYFTRGEAIRASLRREQPFFGRDLTPQRSQTLGVRLLISTIIFSDDRSRSSAVEEAWKQQRRVPGGSAASGTASTSSSSPAALSMAPVATQTRAELQEALGIINDLLGQDDIAQEYKRDLRRLQISFGDIVEIVKRAESDSAAAWLETATNRALYIVGSHKKIARAKSLLVIAQKSGIDTATIHNLQAEQQRLEADVEEMLREYTKSLRQLDNNGKEAIDHALQAYKRKLASEGKHDRLKVLTTAVIKHFEEYTNTKRADQAQWTVDLANL